MNCHEASTLIAAAADGEAPRRMRASLAAHVRTCPACSAAQRAVLDLRDRLRTEMPYYRAPNALRARVENAARRAAPAPPPSRPAWRWFGGGALAGALAAVLAWLVVTTVVAEADRTDFARAAVAAHVRATSSDRTIVVASSDQHTVKPWLSARLDYSPPVPLVDETGFRLVGGRLDELQGRPIATLVYRYRDHVVDVFVRPESGPAREVAPRTVRGFNVIQVDGAAMTWTVVSDVSLDTLQGFARTLARTAR